MYICLNQHTILGSKVDCLNNLRSHLGAFLPMYTVCLHYKSKRSGGLLARVDLRTGEVPRGVLIGGFQVVEE